MKAIHYPKVPKLFSTCLLILTTSFLYSQVGIGTITPEGALDISDSTTGLVPPRVALTATNVQAPVTNPKTGVTALVDGTVVYNTNTSGTAPNNVTPGLYYWQGSQWLRLEEDKLSDSVSLTADTIINSTYPTYANVSGMSLSFTAKKTSVTVMLTASGSGYTNSMSIVFLQVQNTTSASLVGGTMTKIQSLDTYYVPGPPGPGGYASRTVTTWSASYSKLLTGLTPGTTYTLQVQGAVLAATGTADAVIQASTTPNAEHLTLSVVQ